MRYINKKNTCYFLASVFALSTLAECSQKVVEKSKQVQQITFTKVGKVPLKLNSGYLLDETAHPLSNILIQYSNKRDTIVLLDKINRCALIYNSSGKLLSFQDNETDPKYPFEPYTVTFNKDTCYTLFYENFKLIGVVGNKVVIEKQFEWPNKKVVEILQPMNKLSNGDFLLATGYNIMRNPESGKKSVGKNAILEFMTFQPIFTLYNSKGEIKKKFGSFPPEFLKEKLAYITAKSYHYVVKNNFIYLKFAVGASIFKYDLIGNLVDEIILNIPDFDYDLKAANGKVNDTIIGFAMDMETTEEVFFIVAYTLKSEGNKISIFTLNVDQKTLNESPLPLGGQWYLMPNAYSKKLYLLHTEQTISEEKIIYEAIID